MAWYQDLEDCDYLGPLKFKAVGWLDHQHDFPKGPCNRAFINKLLSLNRNKWEPIQFLGFHNCNLCAGDGPYNFMIEDNPVLVGASNLWIPDVSAQCIYLAPTLIFHYIEDHEYLPPTAFVEAVLNCPSMQTPEFFEHLYQAIKLDEDMVEALMSWCLDARDTFLAHMT